MEINYIRQLDSFRFFAVFLVIISHWAEKSILNRIPNGFIGVTFFFVLSGFLISGNLFKLRNKVNEGSLTLGYAIKHFFARRTLRIFPLYFFALLILWILIPKVFNGHLLWYLAYSSNFLSYFLAEWQGMLSHFWSLAVEEQFYIIWPFCIILFTQSNQLKIILGFVTGSILFKVLMHNTADQFFTFNDVLPFSCFDAFGIGALLAWLRENKRLGIMKFLNSFFLPLIIWFILLAIFIFKSGYSIPFGLTVSICSALIIVKCIDGFGGPMGKILSSDWLVYFGKISYGLYVYHNLIPWLLRCLTGREFAYPLKISILPDSIFYYSGLVFTINFLMLVIISTASWYLLEKPVLSLKRYFND